MRPSSAAASGSAPAKSGPPSGPGVRDLNQLKALTRAGMGACGSKTCRPMIWRMFKEEGVDLGTVTDRVDRPLFVEVPIGAFAGIAERAP